MTIQTNELIEYFATSTIEFRNAFQTTLPSGKLDSNRKQHLTYVDLLFL